MRWTVAQLAQHEARRAAAAGQPRRLCTRTNFFTPSRARTHARAARIASEDQVQLAVVDHLRWRARPGIVWWHHPAGGWRATATGARLKTLGARAGLPDLLLLIEGRLHGLELKREVGGRLSTEQRAMHAELRAAGAAIETARGLNEALAVLNVWGALKPATTRIIG